MKIPITFAACLLLVGCAAGGPSREPPAAPEYASPPPAAGAPAAPAAESRKAEQTPSVEIAEERRQLDIALGQADCAAACRALGSMEKATKRICALATSPQERDQCRSAEAQLAGARDRVRAACGACSTRIQ